ncbi:MAG: nitroreductase [Bacteroidia bacterium]|nr:MAG: nitroreductase [Bacteroidia bacterium]
MEKPANTLLEIHPVLKKRWSPRAFRDQAVAKDQLQRIFEAARWAPSSHNDQPWRFILGTKGDDTWNKLYECMVDFNRKWAGNAPVLLLAVGKKISDKTGKDNPVFMYDVGQSMAYITFQLEHEGLVAHQMGGFSKDRATELFSIPADHAPLVMMAIGYQDAPDTLPADFAKMEKAPRSRKPIGELVFSGSFGKAAKLD